MLFSGFFELQLKRTGFIWNSNLLLHLMRPCYIKSLILTFFYFILTAIFWTVVFEFEVCLTVLAIFWAALMRLSFRYPGFFVTALPNWSAQTQNKNKRKLLCTLGWAFVYRQQTAIDLQPILETELHHISRKECKSKVMKTLRLQMLGNDKQIERTTEKCP